MSNTQYYMSSMLLPVVLVVLVVSSVQSCPTGGDRVWVELGDSCYSTSRDQMDWGTAQEVSLVHSDTLSLSLFLPPLEGLPFPLHPS